MSQYPGKIDNFNEKLGYSKTGHVITNQALEFAPFDANFDRAKIPHDSPTNILIKENGNIRSLGTHYTLVVDTGRPWITYAQRAKNISATWTIDYKTPGDHNEAADINRLQGAIKNIQETLGTNPQLTAQTVKALLEGIMQTLSNLNQQALIWDGKQDNLETTVVNLKEGSKYNNKDFYHTGNLAGATTSNDGLLTAGDKTKIDRSLQKNAQGTMAEKIIPLSHDGVGAQAVGFVYGKTDAERPDASTVPNGTIWVKYKD